MKDGSRRLNLLTFDGSEKFDDIGGLQGYSAAIKEYAARRLPPLSPEEVTRRLETELKFTGRGDIPVVAELYRTFFEHAAVHAKHLDFGRLGWGSEQLEQLAELFPRFLACEELNLAGNTFGAAGAALLASLLRNNSTLTSLEFAVLISNMPRLIVHTTLLFIAP